MVRTHNENLWVGVTDRGTEGIWRFITDNTFYRDYKKEEENEGNHLFPFASGEPDNSDGKQHCALVRFTTNDLDDDYCSVILHGLCEIKD